MSRDLLRTGLVVKTEGPEYVVRCEDQAGHRRDLQCILKGKRLRSGKPVVGDHVTVAEQTDGRSVIVGVEPRSSLLERLGFGGRGTRPLVANIDLLVVVGSASAPPLRPGLLDRYIVAAEKEGVTPFLCFNKWELADEQDTAVHDVYAALGYPSLETSAETGLNVEALSHALEGHQSAFVGHSGVGKSSLMQRIFPDVELEIGELHKRTGRGRHTTTHARLLELPGGGYVVDTPGIREFGLVGVESVDLEQYFVDFEEARERCKFSPCTHTHEPRCGVKDAVESGEISEIRYDGYAKLYAELQATEADRY